MDDIPNKPNNSDRSNNLVDLKKERKKRVKKPKPISTPSSGVKKLVPVLQLLVIIFLTYLAMQRCKF